MDPQVFVVRTALDVATDAVVGILEKRGVPYVRFNVEDFPFDCGLTSTVDFPVEGSFGSFIQLDSELVSLQAVKSMWYRRIRSPERPEDMAAGVYDFCVREARAALLGSVLSHPARVMSPPANIWAAEHKIFQLTLARSVGLPVPQTLVTNEPRLVRSAFEQFKGQMIVKPVRSGFVDYGDEQHAIYTSQVLEHHLENVENARWSPSIYQPRIPKLADVRVTVVGSEFFVAEIDSQSDSAAEIDWRRTQNPELPHRRASIPSSLRQSLELLLLRLGLSFAAIDLIKVPSGDYVFLEVNPSGQWLWLDDFLGFGITEAVADWLLA